MSTLASMFKAIEFIENNLKREITVADIADAVCYSLYHFCRTFNRVIHHTPYDYLMRRRLSESARKLVQTDKKIIEIAFDYQFNSPETYGRAFKRMFGMQPNQWRKQGCFDSRCLMSRLTLPHIQHLNKGDYLRPRLEQIDAFQVAGVMALVKDDPTVTSLLWEILAQELEGLPQKKPEKYFGITYYPENWDKSGHFYLAGIVTQSPDIVSIGLVVKTIPAMTWAKFIHKGPDQDLELTLDYIYQTWLPKSGRTLSLPLMIQNLGHDFRGFDCEETETEIHIPIS